MAETTIKSLSECCPECQQLAAQANLPGRVGFVPSPIGPLMQLAAPGGVATLALLGAQMIAWRPSGGEEVLFWPSGPLPSPDSGEEIHGGIPVCWPWFGRMGPTGSSPHGLARYCRFAVESVQANSKRTQAHLVLESGNTPRADFPHPFRLEVDISLGATLVVSFRAANTGEKALSVTAGFHPYLKVSDSDAVHVEGLEGSPFFDWSPNTDGQGSHEIQSGVYRPAPGSRIFDSPRPECRLLDPGLHRMLHLRAEGHSRWCIWRSGVLPPGTSRGNLRADDVRSFVCVEPVVFPRCDAISLAPGGTFSMSLELRTEAIP